MWGGRVFGEINLRQKFLRLRQERFANAAMWSLIASVLSSGGTLMLFMFVARMLGKYEYGILVITQSTLGTFGLLAGMGVGLAASKFAAEYRLTDQERLGAVLVLCATVIVFAGSLLSSAVFFFAKPIAQFVFDAPDIAPLLGIAAPWVVFSAIDGYSRSVLLGLEENKRFTFASAVGTGALYPIMLTATWLWGISGAVIGLALAAMVQSVISLGVLRTALRRQSIPVSGRFWTKDIAIIWRFAVPALAASILVTPSHWIAQALLARSPDGYSSVAVFGIALQWIALIMFVPSAVSRVAGPILMNQMAIAETASAKETFLRSIAINARFCMPMALVIALASPWIMNGYGAEFRDDYLALVIAAVTAGILAVLSPVANLVVARSQMWLGFAMNLGWSLVYITLATALIRYGELGVLAALMIAYVAHSAWSAWFVLAHLPGRNRQSSSRIDIGDRR